MPKLIAVVAVLPALLLLATAGAAAPFRFPPGLQTDESRGTWVMQEANRIGLEAIAMARRRPPPEQRLRDARAALQAMLDPCVALGRQACSDGLTFINYYTERIDEALKPRRASRGAENPDEAYHRAIEAKRLASWEHEMMVARRAWVGMPEDLLRLAWGPPDRVDRTGTAIGASELWSYRATSSSVMLLDGHVTAITQTREAP